MKKISKSQGRILVKQNIGKKWKKMKKNEKKYKMYLHANQILLNGRRPLFTTHELILHCNPSTIFTNLTHNTVIKLIVARKWNQSFSK